MDRGRSTRARVRSRRWITFVSLCIAGLASVALGAAPASASTTTLSSATMISGVSTLASQPFNQSLLGVTATGTA